MRFFRNSDRVESKIAMTPGRDEQPIHVVLSTCPPDAATRLARALVESKLAACVSVVPQVKSYYWWEGNVQEDGESLLVLKCRSEDVAGLTERLRTEHPYDVPEIVALEVTAGNRDYLEWVHTSTERD